MHVESATYCSYANIDYLPRFMALVQSIRLFDKDSEIYLLCLDEMTLDLAPRLFGDSVTILDVKSIESGYPELLGAKLNRTPIEYVFTLTPYLMRHVQARTDSGSFVIYLDADLYFVSSPEFVVREIESSDVGIIPHGYPGFLSRALLRYGKFNVGWVGVRNSENGRVCLEWWANRCLEWCGDQPMDGKYADQGYLDQFPKLFTGVKILENRGFNLAPWNTSGIQITEDKQGRVIVAGQGPLVFFHFHGLKRIGKWMVTSQLNYKSPASKQLIDLVYKPYLQSLKHSEELLDKFSCVGAGPRLVRGRGLRKAARNLVSKILALISVFTGNAIDMSRLN
jgi:hypothetical protein